MTQDREELKRLAESARDELHANIRTSRLLQKDDKLCRFQMVAHPKAVLSLLSDLEAMQEALRRASVDLSEARDMVTSWGAYADPYIQEKHGLENDIAGLSIAITEARRALSKEPEA